MIISPDHYLHTDDGKYVWSPERVKEAWKIAMLHLDQALASPRFTKVVLLVGIPASGKSTWLKTNHEPDAVYFDATFTGYRARAPVIDAVKKAGKRIEAVLLDTPIAVCLERNGCRPVDRTVPTETVVNMAVRLTQEPPTISEGLDKVTKVRYQETKLSSLRVAARWVHRVADEAPIGGVSENKRPEDFVRDDLAKGITIEMKDTADAHRATQLAMRHLTENPSYYKQIDPKEDK